MVSLYENPYYYDVAFSFRDIGKEVDFFQQCIKKFSKIKVRKVLEIGCGPSPYLFELAKRGYTFTGLDESKKMLEYSVEKAENFGVKMKTIHADMRNFETTYRFDFAFCMLGSIAMESNEDFLSHLASMSKCLKRGSLYLIDAVPCTHGPQLGREEWTVQRNGLTVNVTWEENPLDLDKQMTLERITVTVKEGEEIKVLREERPNKFLLLQEFLGLIEKNGKFEFIGRYNNFDLNQPLEQATKINRPITILRKK